MDFFLNIFSNIVAGVVVFWLVVKIPLMIQARRASKSHSLDRLIIEPSWKRVDTQEQTLLQLLKELSGDLRETLKPMFGVLGAVMLFLLYGLRWFTITSVASHLSGWILTVVIAATCYWMFMPKPQLPAGGTLSATTRWERFEKLAAVGTLPVILCVLLGAAVWLVYFTDGMRAARAHAGATMQALDVGSRLDGLDAKLEAVRRELSQLRATTQPNN